MIDHALLPSVVNASLPAKYEAAAIAISECEKIDECKDWADKSAALASYAKQSNDKTLEQAAMRIRARAVRRCGELLQEVEKANGANQNIGGDTPTKVSTRKDAATAAGLSKDQAVTALRVANVPRESFETQVESPKPPTVTALAAQGKKPANRVPLYEQLGMTKEQFQAGMHFRGEVETFVAATKRYRIADVIAGTVTLERYLLKGELKEIITFSKKLISKL